MKGNNPRKTDRFLDLFKSLFIAFQRCQIVPRRVCVLSIEATGQASRVFDGGEDIPKMRPFMADAGPLPGGVLKKNLRGSAFGAAVHLVEARGDAGNAYRLAIAEVGPRVQNRVRNAEGTAAADLVRERLNALFAQFFRRGGEVDQIARVGGDIRCAEGLRRLPKREDLRVVEGRLLPSAAIFRKYLNRFAAIVGCAGEREVKAAGHRFVSSKTHGRFDTTKLLLGAASVNPPSVVDARAFLAASGPDALAPLFEGCANRCHCRYWHFVGTKNEWLEKCAFRPEDNASELSAAIGAEADDGHGLVALSDGIPVGWLKVAPRTSVPKLRNQGVYKRLELANDGVWVVVCLLVAEQGRRQGVARALIGAVDDYVRRRGGHTIEALPRVEERELHAEEAFAGPWILYRDAGFEEVAGERPYSVFRKRLRELTP